MKFTGTIGPSEKSGHVAGYVALDISNERNSSVLKHQTFILEEECKIFLRNGNRYAIDTMSDPTSLKPPPPISTAVQIANLENIQRHIRKTRFVFLRSLMHCSQSADHESNA
jgi:hypothetical protein